MAIKNANDGINLAQTAEGAMAEVTDMLQRMRELAVQAGNSTNTDADRAAMNDEITQLKSEINRIASTTQFNGMNILDGSFQGKKFQIGNNAGQTMDFGVMSVATTAMGETADGLAKAATKASLNVGGVATSAAAYSGVSFNATVGQPYGTIQGKTWNTVNGERLVKSNGRYSITTTTTNVIGNMNPNWIGGLTNTFKYKNLSLSALIDVKQGGNVFSLDQYYGQATGVYPESAALNDLGNPSRDAVSAGGGVIMPGVLADGSKNTIRVENNYGTFGYAQNPAAAFVYDASFVKLREANLTYTLPRNIVSKLGGIKGVDLSVFGRNLWIIKKYVGIIG